MTPRAPRKPPRKRTRKQAKRPEPEEMRPEPVEAQHEGDSTSSTDEGASTGSAHTSDEGAGPEPADSLHKEADEKAPIKGAVPEGEAEPDTESKPESLT